MKIIFDWRLSRVVDEQGNIVDEIFWDGQKSPSSVANRLLKIQQGRIIPEVKTLSERFPEAQIDPIGVLSEPNWPRWDESEEVFQRATLLLARMGVADSSRDMDRRLEMLVSATLEARSSWVAAESRCIEWAGLFITEADLDSQRHEIPQSIASSGTITEASEKLGVSPPKHMPSDSEWSSMVSHASSVTSSSMILEKLEDSIREIATNHMPSLSELLGPISAAKMVSLAGGRERLARMPSGSLQVLGAHAAMSAHRRGAPPPKHGSILFSMPQVSRSPRWVRGKIARYLAGKASIAVRVDHFDGETWGKSQIDEINSEIEAIKAKFPKPPKRS